MPKKPTVSIVTPSFNGADFIQQAIDSIREQDYPYIEHIVMDGGSTDSTPELLRANQGHLTYVSEVDQGQSDALNKGFARSSGDYLTWLNTDDILYPSSITRSVKLLGENPGVGLVYGRLNLLHRDGTLWRDDSNVREGTYAELLNWDNFVCQPGTLFTRRAWEECGPLSTVDHYAMDWDLWIKIAARFPIKYTPHTLAALRIYPETKTASGGLERFQEILTMLERNGSKAPHLYYKIGLWHYNHSQMAEARRYFSQALRRGPSPKIRHRLIGLILKSFLGRRIMTAARAARAKIGS